MLGLVGGAPAQGWGGRHRASPIHRRRARAASFITASFLRWEDGDAFGLFDCTYTKQEELQFIGSELPSYIELSATNSQYTMTPQSCVGKMDCNPKNGEKVVGTSEWPPAEWTRV